MEEEEESVAKSSHQSDEEDDEEYENEEFDDLDEDIASDEKQGKIHIHLSVIFHISFSPEIIFYIQESKPKQGALILEDQTTQVTRVWSTETKKTKRMFPVNP